MHRALENLYAQTVIMKISGFYLLLFVNAISAFTSKQLMERLHYIEDKLNDESKFRREDFRAVFQELDSIKRMLDHTLTTKKENKDSEGASVPDKTYIVKHDSILLKAFKKENIVNAQFRREIPIIKRHVQDLEEKTEVLKTFSNEYSLSLKKKLSHEMQTTAETLARISKNIIELKNTQNQILEKLNIHINLTFGLIDTLMNLDNYCTGKENTSETKSIAKESTCPTTSITVCNTISQSKFSSCKDLYDNGKRINGVYNIEIGSGKSISVYCDMTTDGGGWTVFQRRKDGAVDFFLNWDEYKTGFGDVDGEFWLGNEYLNLLTDTAEQHELRVDLEDFEGNRAYAKYSRFKVGPESENYKLEVSGYTGDAGDSLENPSRHVLAKHNGMEFSTKDRDNDKGYSNDCAINFHGAWWYNNCFESNLNGLYHKQSACETEWVCIVWNTWKGSKYSIKFTEMKLR